MFKRLAGKLPSFNSFGRRRYELSTEKRWHLKPLSISLLACFFDFSKQHLIVMIQPSERGVNISPNIFHLLFF